jgi:hypothetical protein
MYFNFGVACILISTIELQLLKVVAACSFMDKQSYANKETNRTGYKRVLLKKNTAATKRKDHPPQIPENRMPRVYEGNGLIQHNTGTDGVNNSDRDEKVN